MAPVVPCVIPWSRLASHTRRQAHLPLLILLFALALLCNNGALVLARPVSTTPVNSDGSCPPGLERISIKGMAACRSCRAGYYQDTRGTAPCSQCPAGSYSAASASSCTPCSPGSYAKTKYSSCTLCPKGSYASVAGAPACTPCGGGRITNTTGSTSRVQCKCPAGTEYRGQPLACLPCAKGMFNAGGSDVCEVCPSGLYSNRFGAVACRKCTAGLTTLEMGSTSYTQCACAPGTQSRVKKSQACDIDCSPGSFNNGTLQTCAKCPIGTYASSSAATSCDDCDPGLHTPSLGCTSSDACVCSPGKAYNPDAQACDISCPKGTFNDGTSQTCYHCPPGMTTISSRSTSSQQCGCPAGQAPNITSRSCADCPQAWYKAGFGPQACTLCPGVFSTAGGGSVSAEDCGCAAGTYLSGKDTCSLCTKGSYNPDTGAVSSARCKKCGVDMTTIDEGSTQPADCVCAAGFYSDQVSGCSACNLGSYSATSGASSCTSCDTGYTPRLGAKSVGACVCPPGLGWDGQTCSECRDPNYNDGTFRECRACPKGTSPSTRNDSCK